MSLKAIDAGYRSLCERLWGQWLQGRLSLPRAVAERFQLDHAPEPYLPFGTGTRPFCLLTTNPGAGLEVQRRDVVLAGRSIARPEMNYMAAAQSLARYYTDSLRGAAKTRIDAMRHLERLVGADYTIQFESLPFHSKALPGKHRLPDLMKRSELLESYTAALAEALRSLSVIALSAIGSSRSISASAVSDHPWLRWQCGLLAIDPDALTLQPLVEKGSKVSSALLYQRSGARTSAFVLIMGGNHFPGLRGRERIARIISVS